MAALISENKLYEQHTVLFFLLIICQVLLLDWDFHPRALRHVDVIREVDTFMPNVLCNPSDIKTPQVHHFGPSQIDEFKMQVFQVHTGGIHDSSSSRQNSKRFVFLQKSVDPYL